jgi:hypothetical protein
MHCLFIAALAVLIYNKVFVASLISICSRSCGQLCEVLHRKRQKKVIASRLLEFKVNGRRHASTWEVGGVEVNVD